jgi:c-di-GMP-related signal transduction protein
LNFYVPRQCLLNKNLLAYEFLFRNSLKNRHVCAATAKIIDVLVITLGLKSLTQSWLAFICFGHDPLINGYCLSSKQYFQPIISALTPCPNIQPPSEKIDTYSGCHPPVSIDLTRIEAILGECKC